MNRKERRALKPKGVKVSSRNMEAIQKDYIELCAKLGEVELRLNSHKDILAQLNSDKNSLIQGIGKLQKEFDLYQQAEAAKPKTSEEKANAIPFKEVPAASDEPSPAPVADGSAVA